ncbi:class V chitinase-like [Benincasa hispida]|uniref:class V chitinase-like n=1 Tax=Benincasa hispida TaxID=102211 RepID=UPI001900B1D4|nr:class V chitinase-like [Benincasa hispida]
MGSTIINLFFSFIVLLQLHSSAGQSSGMKGIYWFSGSGFPVSDIDSSLFTHIFCAFADLAPNTFQVTISPSNSAKFKTFTQTVQRKNPNVKTLLSIGGGGANADTFAAMASQPDSRKSFISSSISLARSNGFLGLDLDWEYPSNQNQISSFSTLCTEWRAAAEKESQSSGKPRLLLSAAVFRSSNYYGLPLPASVLATKLDWINVMCYDFYGPGWSPNSTAPPAALFGSAGQVNCDAGITSWIQSGFPASKIVLGIPFYGWAWRLVNQNNNGLYAPANGAATGAGIDDGAITYKGINAFKENNRVNSVYNGMVVTNYVSSGTTWIGYDDKQSVAAKVAYAKKKGLFGYFAWQVGADDNWTLSRTASTTWSG